MLCESSQTTNANHACRFTQQDSVNMNHGVEHQVIFVQDRHQNFVQDRYHILDQGDWSADGTLRFDEWKKLAPATGLFHDCSNCIWEP
jgi:hypothetical protein